MGWGQRPPLVIGCLLLRQLIKEAHPVEVRKRVAIVIPVVSGLCLVAFFYPVNMQALRALGVYDVGGERYAIETPQVAQDFLAAGFAELPALGPDGRAPPKSAVDAPGVLLPFDRMRAATVNAFARFRFGDALLLCTTPYDPLESPSPTSPWAARPQAGAHGGRAGADKAVTWKPGNCLLVNAASVRRILPAPQAGS